jgi:DNA-binding response OmpR family regulator
MRDLAGLTVLLVEDEYLIALDAQELLKKLGVVIVETVATFERAEKCAAEGQFDLAVLDVNINGRHSFSIAKTIKERGIPVVFASGYESRDRAASGLDDTVWVTKPYTYERLRAALCAAVAKVTSER